MTSPDGRSVAILFVDDNQALLRSMGRFLTMEGFQVLLAEDGEEALRLLETVDSLPDLIISDIAMPRMDGFAFFEAVRASAAWSGIPFLFLTALDQVKDLERGYLSGADAYLVKPFEEDHLLMVIRGRLKRRDDLLRHIQVEREKLESAKDELAMMVAHELRTPLTSINVVTELLNEDIDHMDSVQVRDLLDTMEAGSVRLMRLVEQMVMYVQLRSGAMADTLRQYFRPRRVYDAVVGAVKYAQQMDYRQRPVVIQPDTIDPDIYVNSDLNSLRHALAELIFNAIVFSPREGVVRVRQAVADGCAEITISDFGIGIPPDELGRVFEPFYQVNRKETEQQGIGLGLTLAKELIEAHDGTLVLHSTPGVGTQVIVRLPLFPIDELA